MRQYENNTIAVQKRLVPYEFKVSPTEVDVLCENLPKLRDAGFSVSHEGGEKFTLSRSSGNVFFYKRSIFRFGLLIRPQRQSRVARFVCVYNAVRVQSGGKRRGRSER